MRWQTALLLASGRRYVNLARLTGRTNSKGHKQQPQPQARITTTTLSLGFNFRPDRNTRRQF